MRFRSFRESIGFLIAVCFCLSASGVAAQEMKPSANILLPYFEVRLPEDDAAMQVDTTLAIANASAIATDVEITVYTNWGIPVLTFSDKLRGAQPRAIELEQWIGQGRIPGRTLTANELAELQAALTGRPSPTDHLYRGTADDDGLAVGYVIARAIGEKRDVLWGDTYGIDATSDSFRGDTLATLDDDLQAECSRHAIRFINRDALFEGTQLILWTGRVFEPSPTTEPIGPKVKVVGAVYDEEGNHVGDCMRDVVAVQVIEACSMPSLPASGWIDIALDQPAFVQQHLHAVTAASAELHAWCLPEDLSFKDTTAAVSLDKYVNHRDADRSPGAGVRVGDALRFTYSVWNSGALPLQDIVVTDSEGLEVTCPESTLQPGKWMECTAPTFKALPCVHKTSATVVASTLSGAQVSDTDAAWYKGTYELPRLTLEAFANGRPAVPKFLYFTEDEQVVHTIRVTNPGPGPAENIQIENSPPEVNQHDRTAPPISCPATSLAPGASMTCTSAPFLAAPGTTWTFAWFRWNGHCDESSDSDSVGVRSRVAAPEIRLVKWINRGAGNTHEQPVRVDFLSTMRLDYAVTNTGDFPLVDVTVTDDITGVVVTCPSTTMPAFTAFMCTASSGASAGLWNVPAAVRAWTEDGHMVEATDTQVWYFGETHPAIDLETFIQSGPKEYDADDPAVPLVFATGSTFTVRYVVKNTGDCPLTMVGVADNTASGPLCMTNALAAGDSISCTRTVQALPGPRSHTIRAFGAATSDYGGAAVEDHDPIHYLGIEQ